VGQQLVGRAGERGTDVAAPVRSGTEEEPVRDGEAEVGGGLPALPVGQQIGGGRYRYQRLSTVDILAPGTAGEEVRYGVTRRGRSPERGLLAEVGRELAPRTDQPADAQVGDRRVGRQVLAVHVLVEADAVVALRAGELHVERVRQGHPGDERGDPEPAQEGR